MALRFNIEGLTNEILNKLEEQLDYAFIAWRTEVLSKLKHPFYGTGERPVVEYEIKKEGKIIIGYLKANAYVLADSYGTGSLMLLSNPGYQEYRNSDRWNPVRAGKAIVGRRSGNYKNVFGKIRHSSGSMEGHNLEGWEMRTGFTIQPSAPSYAVQLAEQWLYKTYLPNAYKLAVQSINFSKYLVES